MPPREVDVQHRLEGLVARACSKQQNGASLDPALLSDIKILCRQSDDHVHMAWEALWGQLRAPHAQSRLLALLLCEQLFQRSRAFRRALLGRLSQFLEAVVGFRADRPLPPPAHTAATLREKALELLELWDQDWGAKYKQLPLAVRYLRDTLQYRFPELAPRAAAAAAERAAREERQRAALRQRLGALLGSSGEWREGAAAARQLLREMSECFAILDEQQAAQQAQQQQGQEQQPDGADGLQWEEVAADAAPTAPEPAGEGLAAYAAGDGAAVDGDAAGDGKTDAAENAAELEAVTETLAGLYRQLTNRALPQLQDWLSVLGRAEPEGPAQEAEQQRVLRAATELRGQLAAAKERCDAMDLDLQALLLRRQRREAAAAADGRRGGGEQRNGRQRSGSGQGGQQVDAVEAAIHELFGDSDSDEEEAIASRRAAQRPQNTAAGPQRRQQQGQAQAASAQRRRQARPSEYDFQSPYLRIVDPTVVQQRPAVQLGSSQQRQTQTQRQQQQPQRSSSLPEEVRKKLAAQAPVLPTGPHTLFWDSKSVPTFVSGHGLEVSNHWGPVDVHQELPPERVDELFMLPMPASRPQAAGQGGQAARRPGQQQAERERERQRQQREAQRAAERQQQQQQLGEAGTSAAAQLAPWPSQLGAAAAATGGQEGRAAKRARRAEERAYNEAVIGGALSDELLARQLADADADAAAGQAAGQQADKRRGRQPKKISVKNRLAQKLLRGGVVAAAVRDQQREEGEMRREKFSNRW